MDKLKSKINDCLYNFSEDHDIQLPEGHRAKYVTKILAAAKHGVCVDCKLYRGCEVIGLFYDTKPDKFYCQNFSESGKFTTNDFDNPEII